MAESPINQKAALRRRMEESGAEGDAAAETAKKAAAPAPAASATVRFTREYSAEDREKQKRGLAEALKKRGY